jgi:hypothetical protein
MGKSLKLSKNMCRYTLYALFIVALYLLYNCINKPLIEGVIFTNYDKSKLFTEPWGKFCIPESPSCTKNIMEGPAADGTPQIGCWCKGVGDAGDLDTTCQGIDYNHFY